MAGITHKAKLVMKERGKPFGFEGQNQFDDSILSPLQQDGGVVFPYTPTIMMAHSTNYGTYDVAGSIYQQNYYMNTPNPSISITAQFSSNSEEEARYTLAALHFFKTCMKSDFGAQAGATAGTPPPILKFSCFGHVHASNVPCVIRAFNYTLVEDTDYMEITIAGEKIAAPTLLLTAVELVPQLTPRAVREKFNIRTFATGSLLNGDNSGGFI